MYKIAYDDMCMIAEHLREGQTLKLNEDYLSALMKFDHLHRTLSDMIGGDIHETMGRVQNHIKMFKKAEGKGLFSVERLNENK
jgi:hypothetical protein